MSAINELSKEWQGWITANFNKGIARESIAKSLFKKGWINAAIEVLNTNRYNINVPLIDLTDTQIILSDSQVSIGFICYSPFIVQIHDFLSLDECRTLIDSAEGNFRDSKVVNPEDGTYVKHDARTSLSIGYQRGQEPILTTIESRIAELLNWSVHNGEGLQVLKYENGGEYRPHYDYFAPEKKSSEIVTQSGGQRVGTFLMYLSEVAQGGSTKFPRINLEVRPRLGSALYFANTNIVGEVDKMTLHAGMPVTKGVKYLATKWLRQTRYGS